MVGNLVDTCTMNESTENPTPCSQKKIYSYQMLQTQVLSWMSFQLHPVISFCSEINFLSEKDKSHINVLFWAFSLHYCWCSCSNCTSTHHNTVQESPPKLDSPEVLSNKHTYCTDIIHPSFPLSPAACSFWVNLWYL